MLLQLLEVSDELADMLDILVADPRSIVKDATNALDEHMDLIKRTRSVTVTVGQFSALCTMASVGLQVLRDHKRRLQQ